MAVMQTKRDCPIDRDFELVDRTGVCHGTIPYDLDHSGPGHGRACGGGQYLHC